MQLSSGIKIFCTAFVFNFTLFSYAAVPLVKKETERIRLQEELTGVKNTTVTSVRGPIRVGPAKALNLARQSFKEKKYILALKRYNFVIKFFPQTEMARLAMLDKSRLYTKIGLKEPAQYNQVRASQIKR